MPLLNSEELAGRILGQFGLRAHRFLPADKGYRNDVLPAVLDNGREVNIIIFKCEPGILDTVRRADTVSNFLTEKGLPCRQRLDSRIIELRGQNRTRYATIYNRLPGATIPWEAYTKNHIKTLGKTMGDMHELLGGCDAELPDVEDIYLAILKRMRRYFTDKNVQRAMHEKLDVTIKLPAYEPILKNCKKLKRRQPLHMDFVRGNILFDDTEITGILDFEKTAKGHPLFDIARTLAFLLVDCKEKTPEQVRKYFLYSGYHKRSASKLPRVKIADQQLLEILTNLFLTHDFYKFLCHNPYEFLGQNEHYARTAQLLLDRGLSRRVSTAGQKPPPRGSALSPTGR